MTDQNDQDRWNVTKITVASILTVGAGIAVLAALLTFVADEEKTFSFTAANLSTLAQTLGAMVGGALAAFAAFYIADRELRRRRDTDQKNRDAAVQAACHSTFGHVNSLVSWLNHLLAGSANFHTTAWKPPTRPLDQADIENLVDIQFHPALQLHDPLLLGHWAALKKQGTRIDGALRKRQEYELQGTRNMTDAEEIAWQKQMAYQQMHIINNGANFAANLAYFLRYLAPSILVKGYPDSLDETARRLRAATAVRASSKPSAGTAPSIV